MTDGSSLRPIASARMLATVTAHLLLTVVARLYPAVTALRRSYSHRPFPAHHRSYEPTIAAARHHQVPACSRHPVTARHGVSAHLQPDRHRWSAARHHRSSPRDCSCRPITARHHWAVARCHCPSPSPPSCHYLPSRHQPHDTVRHCFHLDGDGELHTGGLTCYRPPVASPAAFGSLHRLRYVQIFAILQTKLSGRGFVNESLWARIRGRIFSTAKIWRYGDLRDLRMQKFEDTKKYEMINADM